MKSDLFWRVWATIPSFDLNLRTFGFEQLRFVQCEDQLLAATPCRLRLLRAHLKDPATYSLVRDATSNTLHSIGYTRSDASIYLSIDTVAMYLRRTKRAKT